MNKLFTSISLLLFSSQLFADQCHVPSFLIEGQSYELSTASESVSGTVTQIDRKACWLRIDETSWLNINSLQSAKATQLTTRSPFRPQTPVGNWNCRFTSNGKELGRFQYLADGRMVITGSGSNRNGTWSLDSNNNLIWRYENGGGEELDSWEIKNGKLLITEGADGLTCDPL